MSASSISIIIATHNRATLLPVAIESALAAGPNVEVVVVDDASTDETPRVCAEFPEIRVVRLPRHGGLSAARNAGIRASRSAYIGLLDDDDRRLPNSLLAQIAALEKSPDAALCYAPVQLGDPRTNEPTGGVYPETTHTGDIFWKLVRGNFVPGLSVVARRDAIFAAGLFDPKLREVEDWDLWLRLSERAPFVCTPETVAVYRMFERTSRQLSSDRARISLVAAAVQRRALRLPRARAEPARARECREFFLRVNRYTLLVETADALIAGDRTAARRNLIAVLRLLPSSFRRAEFQQLARLAVKPDGEKRLHKIRDELTATGVT